MPMLGVEPKSQESSEQYICFGLSKRLRAYEYEGGETRYFTTACSKAQFEVEVGQEEFCTLEPQIYKLDLILVQINIVTESILANRKLPMLRFVPLKRSNDGKFITVNFSDSRNYISLRSNVFREREEGVFSVNDSF